MEYIRDSYNSTVKPKHPSSTMGKGLEWTFLQRSYLVASELVGGAQYP